jgi:hypothetical protein
MGYFEVCLKAVFGIISLSPVGAQVCGEELLRRY